MERYTSQVIYISPAQLNTRDVIITLSFERTMVRCIIGKRLYSRGDTRARPALNKRTDWIFNESSARYGDLDIARNSAALYRCIAVHAGGNIDRT